MDFLISLLTLGLVVFVPSGQSCALTQFGKAVGTLEPGIHYKKPFGIEGTVCFDTRVQKIETNADAASRDLQTVTSTIALNYQVNSNRVEFVYSDLGRNYEENIIAPVLQESVKAATSKFTAEELVTKRVEVKEEIKKIITEKLDGSGLLVTDFNIVNFSFSESFDKSIEAKVTAEQDALAAKNKLEQIKFEAEQEIEKARGKAEAQRIEGQSLRENPQVIELRSIEKWNGQLPQYMTGTVPFVNLNK